MPAGKTASGWSTRACAGPAPPEMEDHVGAGSDQITALGLLAGDQSLAVGTASGEVSIWFRVRYVRAVNGSQRSLVLDGDSVAPGQERVVLDRGYGRKYGHIPGLQFWTAGQPWTRIRSFAPGPGSVLTFALSPRSRSFAAAYDSGVVRLYHSTSERELLDTAAGADVPLRS